MREVEWLDSATEDVARIEAYLSRVSRGAASRMLQRFAERTEQLADFPNSGREIPELGSPLLRELIEDPYRILYEVFPDRVEIWAVAHSRQQLLAERDA